MTGFCLRNTERLGIVSLAVFRRICEAVWKTTAQQRSGGGMRAI